MSAELEQRYAAQWAQMTYADYKKLPGTRRWSTGDDQSSVLVAYRADAKIRALEMDS